MPPPYPQPIPGGANVTQTGTAALWNANIPPITNFLTHRPFAYLWQTIAQVLPGTSDRPRTPILLNAGYDNSGAHSTTVNTSRYTCQLPGLYHVIGQLGLQLPVIVGTAERTSHLEIRINGTAYTDAPLIFDTGPANTGGTVQASIYAQLRLGDYIDITGESYFNPITTFTDYRRPAMFVHWVSI
ncbi:hypothetical protein GCM10009839_13880 [Catenulispora yoronensis]|uniref:C1q domain-containing protein n=1 Tax=Catenulispora yoronensis TaxID=450799 RepID=A0ABN2TSA6_9ACTN